MVFKKRRYKLRIADPWIEHNVKKDVIKNAEKYLRFREGAKGHLEPLLINYYLEVEEWNGEKFEMPYADICFVELNDGKEPVAFYKLKIYFHLEGEFVYVSKARKSKMNICEKGKRLIKKKRHQEE